VRQNQILSPATSAVLSVRSPAAAARSPVSPSCRLHSTPI